jgi:hypothetical protein
MNINLDNYEQYLLMYVDNELSAAEQRDVESFLRDYPYLREELEQLKQTILPIEAVSFDKAVLLKPVLDEGMQKKLLMHLDGELPAGESLALQNSLAADKMLSKEWADLQKTKLDANDIVLHPDKESLYRKERARVVTGRFLRWAVAAMLIGAGFYTGVNLLNNNKPATNDLAARNNPVKEGQKNTVVPAGNNTALAKVDQEPPTAVSTDDQFTTVPVAGDDVKPLRSNSLAVKNAVKEKNDKTELPKQPNNLPENNNLAVNNKKPGATTNIPALKELPERNNRAVLKAANNDIARLEKQPNSIDLNNNITSRPKIESPDRDLSIDKNTYARTASLSFDEPNNDQILMMEEENISRSKAAIFLKKLKRNVERRTNIKPGKSLRIAGFEFAVK